MKHRFMFTGMLALSLIACRPSSPPATAGAAVAAAPVARHWVVAGDRNPFFVAKSERSLEIAPDVEAVPIKDARGHQHGVRLIGGNNDAVTVECECPGGCNAPAHGSDLGIACIMIDRTPSAPECAGDCVAPDKACGGCSLVYSASGD